jgi:outer membrane protein assembly factor BamB
MGFWSEIMSKVDEPYEKKESEILFNNNKSGIKVFDKPKVQKGLRNYQGKFIDSITGKIKYDFEYGYLGVLKFEFYYAQKGYEEKKWGKFNLDGSKVWIKNEPIHHEILVNDDNSIFTFVRETRMYRCRDVDFDVIVKYDENGKEIERFSLYENLSEFKKYHRMLELDFPKLNFLPFLDFAKRKKESPWGGHYCYYHLNSLDIICENKNSNDLRFQKGNWLISFRHGSMIFILDKDSKKVVWSKIQKQVPGEIQGQHTPKMLSNGNILIMDNGRYRGYSRVIELNPITNKIDWEYKCETGENKFFSLSQGLCQKLDNGNVLITQSESGRCFEVDYKSKEIIWEFYHPEVQSVENSKYKYNYGRRQWIYRMKHFNSID